MDFFDPALAELQESLPSWWAQDPGSELVKVLTVLAAQIDGLSVDAETVHADTALATASRDGLLFEWAFVWGVAQEELPFETETLRGYLQARAAEDGSLDSLINTLLALLRNSANDTGTELRFPISGGIRFPPVSGGIRLHETVAELVELDFPSDGSGLGFPSDGSGLTFPVQGRVRVIEHPADNYFEVFVREVLVFDRAAFARAVNRFRQADDFPPTITEAH